MSFILGTGMDDHFKPNHFETVLTEITFEAIYKVINQKFSSLLKQTLQRTDTSLPTLIDVHVENDVAFITHVKFDPRSANDLNPGFLVLGAERDKGLLYEKDVFVSDQAELEFSEEELLAKIALGQIGEGTCILAGAAIDNSAKFGKNCIVGKDSRIFGGEFGDNVILAEAVWVSQDVVVANGVLIGKGTSLSGKIKIGIDSAYDPDESLGSVAIGDSCALEDCTIEPGTVIGKHCLVENNPDFSGIIPDGATVVATGESFEVIPY